MWFFIKQLRKKYSIPLGDFREWEFILCPHWESQRASKQSKDMTQKSIIMAFFGELLLKEMRLS